MQSLLNNISLIGIYLYVQKLLHYKIASRLIKYSFCLAIFYFIKIFMTKCETLE